MYHLCEDFRCRVRCRVTAASAALHHCRPAPAGGEEHIADCHRGHHADLFPERCLAVQGGCCLLRLPLTGSHASGAATGTILQVQLPACVRQKRPVGYRVGHIAMSVRRWVCPMIATVNAPRPWHGLSCN